MWTLSIIGLERRAKLSFCAYCGLLSLIYQGITFQFSLISALGKICRHASVRKNGSVNETACLALMIGFNLSDITSFISLDFLGKSFRRFWHRRVGLYFTGCRASEIINLKTDQINYVKRQIKVIGKGNFERIVLVNAEIINLIKAYRRKSKCCKDSGKLFTTDRGKKIYPMLLWRLVRRYFKPEKLGINTSAHILRHSIATHLYHNRAPLHSIKRFLGHRSLKTTVLYLHFGPEHLKKVYQDAHPKERRAAAIKLAISTSKDGRN
jgi:hypothetical protein